MVKISISETLNLPKLISRKIWMAVQFVNFHTVQSRLLIKTIFTFVFLSLQKLVCPSVCPSLCPFAEVTRQSDVSDFFLGLQYAYLNGESKKDDSKDAAASKGARSEITLDELDDLYRSEEAEKEAEAASKKLMMASHSNLHMTSIKVNSSTPPPIVRMRSRDDVRSNNNNKAKKINRLSRKLPFLLDFFSPYSFDLGCIKINGFF